MKFFTLSFFSLFILSFVFYICYGKLTETKFDKIKEMFQEKFGYTPLSMQVGHKGGVLFWGYKEMYLINALFFHKLPTTKKILTPEELLFFRTLKNEDVLWIKVKYSSLIMGILFILLFFILVKTNGY